MIVTITFDDSTHKLVPIEPTEQQYIEAQKMLDFSDEYCHSYFAKDFTEGDLYRTMIAAAPKIKSSWVDSWNDIPVLASKWED